MSQLHLEELYLEAIDHIEYGGMVEAKKLFEKILEDDPCYGRAYNYLGWIYHFYFHDYERAEQMYMLAIKYAENFPITYQNYISLLAFTDKWEHLKYILDKSMKIPGVQKSFIMFHYGKLYEHNENYSVAADFYQKGIKATTDETEMSQFKEGIERCHAKSTHNVNWNSVII